MRLSIAHPQTQEQSNFHHLILDIAWFGLAFPATNRFLSVYAIRLGAEANELSLLTSLPAIMLLLSASLSNWWMSRYTNTLKALFWPQFGFRLSFLLPAFTPFMPVDFQPIWLVLSLTLPAIPQGVASVVFLVMIREAVNEKRVTPLLGQRSLILNATVGLSGLALGVWLEKAPFPFNYQAMFVLAFLLTMVSMWHVTQVRLLPLPAPIMTADPAANPWRSPDFLRVGFVCGIAHIAFFSVLPLLPLHLVNNLDAGEGFMALFGLAELAAGAVMAAFTIRLAQWIGNRQVIALALIGTSLGALIVALAPSLHITLLAAALTGGSWTAAGIALFAFFSESTPLEQRSRYTTAYTQIIFMGTFVGPMIGSGLYNLGINLVVIILAGAALRLLAALLTQMHAPGWFRRLAQTTAHSR
ncbi:MAG: MFS transporter [Chloroflexi bacterium]|nr:MFS transporter [Chloroflexota bacterium]